MSYEARETQSPVGGGEVEEITANHFAHWGTALHQALRWKRDMERVGWVVGQEIAGTYGYTVYMKAEGSRWKRSITVREV